MNFKKLALFSLLFCFSSILASAEELSYAAKVFRSDIQSFLREEGFAPSVDNDGSLYFKKEGTAYWIDITGDKPFYVRFYRESLRADNASELSVLKAINDANIEIRAIKCCYSDNCVNFTIESYCYVSEDFKYVFYSYLNILEISDEIVKEAYSKYDNSSSGSSYKNSSSGRSTYKSDSSTASTTSSSRSGITVYINGSILETAYHKWWATSIELNSDNTVVHKIVLPKITNTYVYGTKDEYIEDCDTGNRYYLQSSSIGIDPKKTTLYSKESKSFTDTYPTLPSSVKRINIWSGSGYYARNLQIR